MAHKIFFHLAAMKKSFLFFLLSACISVHAQYPDNIFPDTAHAPFVYGVASGDPSTTRVVIWTKLQNIARTGESFIRLKWEVAADSAFSTILREGATLAKWENDYTVSIDVDSLLPDSRYFYRFIAFDGRTSVTGKARTLPGEGVKHLRLAAVSCSSIWAGYFNAYSRIAERDDIDFLVHLGDYVYDYADKQQLNRMPAEFPKDCASLYDWRERHSYYLLDPDLRAARQNKTWIAEWDNHDTDIEAPGKQEEAIRAFYEHVPIRMPDTLHPENIYRQFKFGTLADLNVIDMHLFRGKEEYAPGKKSVLGNEQHEWLKKQLLESTATWKLIGNQEMMNDWLSEGAPKFVKRGNGRVFDPSNWSGFPEDRQRLFDFIDTNKIQNTVVLTGDIHMSFVIDMTGTPKDKTRYNKRTGQGAIGVEVTTPSVSRLNMKEAGVPGFLIPAVQNFSRKLNPHHVWCKFTKHGYLTLDVTPERCVAEFWYVPIHKKTTRQKFGRGYTVKVNTNRWERKPNKKLNRSSSL